MSVDYYSSSEETESTSEEETEEIGDKVEVKKIEEIIIGNPEPEVNNNIIEISLVGVVGMLGGIIYYLKSLKFNL